MQVYFEGFSSQEDMLSSFSIEKEQIQGLEVLFAYYSYEDYSGEAFVVLQGSGGQLYEVNGSHCSCYGLEGQWDLEETTIAALQKRDTPFFNEVVKAFIGRHFLEQELASCTENALSGPRKKM